MTVVFILFENNGLSEAIFRFVVGNFASLFSRFKYNHYTFNSVVHPLCRDLLSSEAQQKLDIKMNVDGSLFVQGLTSRQVRNLDEVNKVTKFPCN